MAGEVRRRMGQHEHRGARPELAAPARRTIRFATRGTAVCPGCAERIELNFTTRDIGAFEPALPVAVESLRVEAAGCEVIYRLPTSADILAASGAEDLLRRCVEMAHCGPIASDVTALPEEVVSAVVAGMSRADPQAEVRIAIECPWCLYQWSSLFDIFPFCGAKSRTGHNGFCWRFTRSHRRTGGASAISSP